MLPWTVQIRQRRWQNLKGELSGAKPKWNHYDVRQLHSFHIRPWVRKKANAHIVWSSKAVHCSPFTTGAFLLRWHGATFKVTVILFWTLLSLSPLPSCLRGLLVISSIVAKAELVTLELPCFWNKVLVLKELQLIILATSQCLFTWLFTHYRMWKRKMVLSWGVVGENNLTTLKAAGCDTEDSNMGISFLVLTV